MQDKQPNLPAERWFDIENDDIYVYERASRSFEVIDRQRADRLLARFAAKRA